MPTDDIPTSLTQAAYQRLRADLLACRIRPGERVRINDVCRQFEVSLGAVREALSRLTSEGLVVAEPQRGFRAAPITAEELRDLTMVRVDVEGHCLRRSIALGDLAWESQVVSTFHLLSRTPERVHDDPRRVSEAFSQAHGAFHAALVAACASPTLLRVRAQLFAQSERYRRLSVPLDAGERDLNAEHGAIAQAVLARDARTAVRLMTRHLECTTAIVLAGATWLAEPNVPVDAA